MIFLLNSPVIPDDGTYHAESIPPYVARGLVKAQGFISHVGHQGAAEVFSDLLDVRVPVSREPYRSLPGDTAIAIRVRIPRSERRGELTADEVRRVGFTIMRVTRLY